MNKIYLGLALAGLLCTSSCQLEEEPKGQLTQKTFFTSQEELDMSVFALYRTVNLMQTNTNPTIPNWQGDDLTTNPGSNKQAYAEVDIFAPTDANKGINAAWNTCYTTIKSANYIINNADKAPVSKEEKVIALGQAHYWRAVSYFWLVRRFGPVPMNLTGDVDFNRNLSSEAEVYQQIIKDLDYCVAKLPTKYNKEPRAMNGANIYITKQASQATLAGVYMAMGGWPLNDQTAYAKAAKNAKAVIDGVKAGTYEYILEDEYKNVYAPSHNYSNETVVGINFSRTFGSWAEDSQMTSSNLFESLGGWGDGWGEIQFWKDFPEGPRKDATYYKKILKNNGREGETELLDWWQVYQKDEATTQDKNGNTIAIPEGTPKIPEYHPMFCVFSVGNNGADFDYKKQTSMAMTNNHRHRLIRYSEVLLWYAEAQTRAEGSPNALAMECVGKVRQRAGLPNLTSTGQTFADEVAREHGWEVAGYWVALVSRRDDQLRLNTLKETFERRLANQEIEVATGIKAKESVEVPSGTSWQGKSSIYFPYPSLDKSLNGKLKR